jgi:uncharacterized membrane protein
MNQVIAFAFRDTHTAGRARQHLRTVEDLTIDDAAVIVKGDDGSTRVIHEVDRGVKRNALRGSVIGLLIGGLFAPTTGLVLGGLIGAAVGRSKGLGIAHDHVERLGERLLVGESALVVRISVEQREGLFASLDTFGGTLFADEIYSSSDASTY